MTDEVRGNEPLADGMNISLRYRRDFHITDASRLLAAARRAYLDLHPDSDSLEAEQQVSCAAEALFTILEQAGLLSDEVANRLDEYQADGLELEGWTAKVVVDEPWPLSRAPLGNCLRGDVFALPATEDDM
ncbi:hypothetical protein ACFYO1_31760 [Nocardia sp. NPDC006044]|uniref:hypothetical protein n=1 Tax=Nocardia sp. NPDC006044 TaxID=3364306 RepID=UPI0036A8075B